MIAGQNNHRLAILAQHLRGAFQHVEGLAVIVERIAGQHDNVRCDFIGGGQDLGQDGKTIAIAKAVVGAEM